MTGVGTQINPAEPQGGEGGGEGKEAAHAKDSVQSARERERQRERQKTTACWVQAVTIGALK